MIFGWLPFLLVSGVIADSFAGERERHTLETLLASRLSDRTILFGKVTAAISYGWGLTMICKLLGLITVNLVHSEGQLLMYRWDLALGIMALSFLIAALAAGLGILISLRAPTVWQAQQTFSFAFILLFLPLLALPALPQEWQARLLIWVQNTNFSAVIPTITISLIVLDVVLIVAAMARFKRSRLILG